MKIRCRKKASQHLSITALGCGPHHISYHSESSQRLWYLARTVCLCCAVQAAVVSFSGFTPYDEFVAREGCLFFPKYIYEVYCCMD